MARTSFFAVARRNCASATCLARNGLINQQVFEPGDAITYTLRLKSIPAALGTNARYTVTLPSEVVTPTAPCSGTIFVNAGATVTPTVIAALQWASPTGTVFQARVNLNDSTITLFYTRNPRRPLSTTFYVDLPDL